jgi:hypothetical protein
VSGSILSGFRTEAKRRGIPWKTVWDIYCELKAAEWQKREYPNEIRQAAWFLVTARRPGCWPFWRHGFSARWGKKIAKGHDFTIVPGYDTLGQELATLHPEYNTPDGTERLFEFLFSPYDKMPAAEMLLRQAFEKAESLLSNIPF